MKGGVERLVGENNEGLEMWDVRQEKQECMADNAHVCACKSE